MQNIQTARQQLKPQVRSTVIAGDSTQQKQSEASLSKLSTTKQSLNKTEVSKDTLTALIQRKIKKARSTQYEVIKRLMNEFNLQQMWVLVLLSEYKGLLKYARQQTNSESAESNAKEKYYSSDNPSRPKVKAKFNSAQAVKKKINEEDFTLICGNIKDVERIFDEHKENSSSSESQENNS